MEEKRKAMDQIDQDLVSLLAQRIALGKEIVEQKVKDNLPAHDPGREKGIMKRMVALGKEQGLSEPLIKEVYKRIFEETRGKLD